MTTQYLGDFRLTQRVRQEFDTYASAGDSVNPTTFGVVTVFKNQSATDTSAGVTVVTALDGLTGIHAVEIDTSADKAFYTHGADYSIIVRSAVIAGSTVNKILGRFSIEGRKDGAIWSGYATSVAATYADLDAASSAYSLVNQRIEFPNTGVSQIISTWAHPRATFAQALPLVPPSTAPFRVVHLGLTPSSAPANFGSMVIDPTSGGVRVQQIVTAALSSAVYTAFPSVVVQSIVTGALSAAVFATPPSVIVQSIVANAISAGVVTTNPPPSVVVQSIVGGAMTAAAFGSFYIVDNSIAASAASKIADIVLRRATSAAEVSPNGDTLQARSLYGAVARITHRRVRSSTSAQTYRADDTTILVSDVITLTTALSVTEVNPP